MTGKHSFYLLTFFAEKALRKRIMKLIVQDLKITDVWNTYIINLKPSIISIEMVFIKLNFL